MDQSVRQSPKKRFMADVYGKEPRDFTKAPFWAEDLGFLPVTEPAGLGPVL